MQIGRSVVYLTGIGVSERSFMMPISALFPENNAVRFAPTLQEANYRAAESGNEAIEPSRIVNDIGAIERRAEHCRFRNLAAITAAHTVIIDGRDRVILERVVGVFDRERRAARESDASVIAGTHVLVDTEALAYLPLAVEIG